MFISRKPGLNPLKFLTLPLSRTLPEADLYTHFARAAIYHIFRRISAQGGCVAHFPAYMCDTALEPLVKLGIKIEFYGLDEKFNVDLSTVRLDAKSDENILFMAHYFGFRQDMNLINNFCGGNGLILVEDMAHCLPSDSDAPTSDTGNEHYRFFSFRKFFPVPGAAIITPGVRERITAELTPPKSSMILKNVVYDIMRYAAQKMPRFIPLLCSKGDQEKNSGAVGTGNNLEKTLYGLSMSPVSSFLLKRTDIKEAITKRRANFILMTERLDGLKSVKPVFTTLAPSDTPMLFPLHCKNTAAMIKENRDIDIFTWPMLHPLVREGEGPLLDQARRYSEEYLFLPLHEGLSARQREMICDAVIAFDAGGTP
jgi:hypothetical protein